MDKEKRKKNLIHPSNYVHPTAILAKDIKLGFNNYIGPYCIFGENVKIGNNNRFEGFCSIGTAAEHRDYFRKRPTGLIMHDSNVVREFVTINSGTSSVTNIGSNINFLKGAHVGHDCTIKDNVNLSCNALVGGHAIVGAYAHLGLGAAVHQRKVVGAFCMVGMNSTVTRDLIPFTLSFGSPCEIQRINSVGLKRAGLGHKELLVFEEWLQNIFDNKGIVIIKHKYKSYIEDYIRLTQK